MLDLKHNEAVSVRPFELLRRCGGYYKAPRDNDKKLLGPLVGLPNWYLDREGKFQQWVSDAYVDWAVAEADNVALRALGWRVFGCISDFRLVHGLDPKRIALCGVPEGGRSFAAVASTFFQAGVAHICAETTVTKDATLCERRQAQFKSFRGDLRSGTEVFLVKDTLAEDFALTKQLMAEVQNRGARVVAVVALLNSSRTASNVLMFEGVGVPVLPLEHMPMRAYRQDDEVVKAQVDAGNVVLSPRAEWPRLIAAMEKFP